MNGLTPYEKFKKANTLINHHIFKFPVFLMEDILNRVSIFTKFLHTTGGKYQVPTASNGFIDKAKSKEYLIKNLYQ